jgi:hypothetical protein
MQGLIALFVRSLRQTTRSGGTYLLRAGLAAGVLVALIWAHMVSQFFGAPGLMFFTLVFFLNYFYLILAGCGFFATAIAEEKEEGTLGLLRMTNLNALSILLGKSTSRLCAVLLLIAVQVPFVMLGVTMGGVSAKQIASSYALLGLLAFSTANFSLLCSVYYRRVWSASVITLLAIVGIGLVAPNIYRGLLPAAVRGGLIVPDSVRYARLEAFGNWLMNVSPAGHLSQVGSGSFWNAHLAENTVAHLSLGLIFFLAAWWLFERRCQGAMEVPAPAAAGRRRFRLLRPGRPWVRSLAWKDFHFQYGGWGVVALRLMTYALVTVGVLALMSGLKAKISRMDLATGLIGAGTWLLNVELAIFVALLWSREHWGHTLGSIIGLPRSLGSSLREKLRGLAPALIPSLAVIVIGLGVGGSEWMTRYVKRLASNEFGGGIGFVFGMPGWGVWGLARNLSETFWYLNLVAYLSLRLRWTALPAAFGIAMAVTIGSYILFFSIMMLIDGPLIRSGAGTPDPMMLQGILMAVLYVIAGIFIFRKTRRLILLRAGES